MSDYTIAGITVSLTVDGTATGYVGVADNTNFAAGEIVNLRSSAVAAQTYIVTDLSGTTLVGLRLASLQNSYGRSDVSAYLVGDSAIISGETQNVTAPPIVAGLYTNANVQVDKSGRIIGIASGTDIDVGTLTGAYNSGTMASDQTLLIAAGKGGPVILKGNGALTGSLIQAQTSGAVVLMNISDNADQVIRSARGDVGGSSLIVDTSITVTSAAARLISLRNNGTEQVSVDQNGNFIFIKEKNHTLTVSDTTTLQTLGGNITLQGAASSAADATHLSLPAGNSQIFGGTGGLASAAHTGGVGGIAQVGGGTGGGGSAAQHAGAGGNLNIFAGTGGADNGGGGGIGGNGFITSGIGTGNAASGNLYLDCGTNAGTGISGSINIGTNFGGTTASLNLGATGVITTLIDSSAAALGTTFTPHLTLLSSTAAGNGAQQVSPGMLLQGQVWNTTGAATSNAKIGLEALPIQGSNTTVDVALSIQSATGAGSLAELARFHTNSQNGATLELKGPTTATYIAGHSDASTMLISPGIGATRYLLMNGSTAAVTLGVWSKLVADADNQTALGDATHRWTEVDTLAINSGSSATTTTALTITTNVANGVGSIGTLVNNTTALTGNTTYPFLVENAGVKAFTVTANSNISIPSTQGLFAIGHEGSIGLDLNPGDGHGSAVRVIGGNLGTDQTTFVVQQTAGWGLSITTGEVDVIGDIIPNANNSHVNGADARQWEGVFSYWYSEKLGAQLTAAASILPTSALHHVTGATPITTITATNVIGNGRLTLIADSATITFSTGGNIAFAGSFSQNQAQTFVYDKSATTWYPVV